MEVTVAQAGVDLLFCNSFLQHNPTPLAGHRQEKTEKKRVSEGWHRAFLCSKQKPIDIICKWVYFVDRTFTNGKGRGYNVQNQRDQPGACAGSYPESHCGPCVGRSCPDRRKAHAAYSPLAGVGTGSNAGGNCSILPPYRSLLQQSGGESGQP